MSDDPELDAELERQQREHSSTDVLDGEHPNDGIEIVVELDETASVVPARPRAKLDKATLQLVLKNRMMTARHISNLPPVQWFVEGLLPAAPITIMHGPGGARKSFVMLDWMLCADQQLDWHGKHIRPGKCLYVAGEGVRGTGKRLRAWCAMHERTIDDLHIDFMSIPFNLYGLTDEGVDRWAAIVDHLGYEYVVIDTMHTASAGADENSSQDIGKVFDSAKRIAGEHTHLFFLHHDPKNGKNGKTARGSSAIRDDADVVIEIAKDPNLALTSILRADKIRDADDFPDLKVHFEVYGVDLESSLYVTSVGSGADPLAASQGQRILNILTDHPGSTKNEVLRLMNTKNDTKFNALVANGEIWTRKGDHLENGKLVPRDLWFVKGHVDVSD